MKVGPDEQYTSANVVPLHRTRPVEAPRWPVAGCIVGLSLTTASLLGLWYLIWRAVVRLVDQFVRLT